MRIDHHFLFQVEPKSIDALSCASLFQQMGISLSLPISSSVFKVEHDEIFEYERAPLNFADVLDYFRHGNGGDDFSCEFFIGETPFTAGFFTFASQRLFLIHLEDKYASGFIDAIEALGHSVYAVMTNLVRSFSSTRMVLCRDALDSDLLISLQSSPEDVLKLYSVTALLLPRSNLEFNLSHFNVTDLDEYRLYYCGDFF